MAAAYASLVSLSNAIDDHIHRHPHPPISLRRAHIRSLLENVAFFLKFLEGYSHGRAEVSENELEGRLARAACAALEFIESQTIDEIIEKSTNGLFERRSSVLAINEVIESFESIKNDASKIKLENPLQPSPLRHPSTALAGSSTVGFDDLRIQIMDKLTGQRSSRQVVSIVGMGGSGKTTLAQEIYSRMLTVRRFDLQAWVTISHDYSVRGIILDVLSQVSRRNSETLSRLNDQKLELELYQTLCGRRYLIVMDDMWDIEAWESTKFLFPDNGTHSRMMITTRLADVALIGSYRFKMTSLDERESWKLLCTKAFGRESCPNPELEFTGKKIVSNCKGLPLSIVVIGGLLARSEMTLEYWKYVADNLSSTVNSADDEHCLKVLSMSYVHLPVRLRPCFLYVGCLRRDKRLICASKLVRLWVAEGFVKPVGGETSEALGLGYLKDLVDRNLVLVDEVGPTGKIKFCSIHELLRDLCLREAQKDSFISIASKHILETSLFPSLAKYLRLGFEEDLSLLEITTSFEEVERNYRLRGSAFFSLVHSRYISLKVRMESNFELPSSMYMLWNLQTIIITGPGFQTIAPSAIWAMPQLRHIECSRLRLPDPPSSRQSGQYCVLRNLQTLLTVQDFELNEEVVKRVINVKKLKLYYQNLRTRQMSSYLHFVNMGHLQKLESLGLYFHLLTKPSRSCLTQNLALPNSLKKLTFYGGGLRWEDIKAFIGSLPLLEVLKLKRWSFKGSKWDPIEGQFRALKLLLVDSCHDLELWTAESVHFPLLEHLILRGLDRLKEVPQGIGDIPTLRLIHLDYCSESSVVSAKGIVGENEDDGECDVRVRVRLSERNEEIASLASPNFQVEVTPWIPQV